MLHHELSTLGKNDEPVLAHGSVETPSFNLTMLDSLRQLGVNGELSTGAKIHPTVMEL